MPDEEDMAEQQPEQEIDPHQALEAMASAGRDAGVDALAKAPTNRAAMESEDALEAMAAGQFEAPPSSSAPADDGDNGDGLPGGEPADVDSGEALDAMGQGGEARAATEQRQAMRVARRQQTSHVHAMRFKKTMIPVLLVVGGLLLVLSGVTVFILLTSAGGQAEGTMLSEYGPVVVMVACPLAAVLMAGAWWFHHEAGGAAGE